ncbi:uncharacterized protein GGS25DRAFT_391592 [Hypoxylon fragiforme]|uniref:uncharacterized protein n=1 Tax=Hypoxylon fragiforme TaxID=63214 RepID=UPI0020C67392|nr:uncharacterized protein GGS25DRAFT_391592 [Hypoxylon fragiforme]KAI2606472.1 hypothetical protein GGS25DRAFT_391592 [Hypoxylon fragiforme]
MANDSASSCCGLFHPRPRLRPTPRSTEDHGLQGVEFSPRSSIGSSTASAPAQTTSSSAPLAAPATNIDNPEIAGYYSPPAPVVLPAPLASQEIRGYYAPEPAVRPQPTSHPPKMSYS